MKRRAAPAEASKITAIRVGIEEIYGGMIRERAQQDASLAVLAASIAKHGLLSPVLVRRNAQMGRYALVCGARRLLACRMLGMREIDALLITADEQEAAACFMEEHLTRCVPQFMDEARLLQSTGLTQEHCVLPAHQLERRIRMLSLSERVREAVQEGELTLEQAEPLLGIKQEERQMEAASIIASRGLTPQQARRLVFAPVPAEEPAAGKRRAIRMAMEEASCTAERMKRQGVQASVSVHSQEKGICIQILLKNPENLGKEQEKERKSENKQQDSMRINLPE